MEVPQGVIYGLLGPSGCGKTTLLRCIVGRLSPKNGLVQVFGSKPGSKTSCVPGRGIGYMPQELAVYGEFTIEETLSYFGRLQRLSTVTLKERTAFLVKFLDLPDKKRLVKNLSGGQQRRVSLAAALIHQPPLLILDEPTVGVDPLLRQNIWNHLVTLATEENMTIIITTHYIEEARQANIVGLMRKGRLLAEESPTALMQKWNQVSLEDVFLTLCRADIDSEDGESSTRELNNVATTELNVPEITIETKNNKENELYIINEQQQQTEIDRTINQQNIYSMSNSTLDLIRNSINDLTKNKDVEKPMNKDLRIVAPSFKGSCVDSATKTATLFNKNVTRLRRNIGLLLFNFALPALQMILFCLCIGRDPFDLTIAVVNQENPSVMSKFFLEKVDNHTLIQKPFNNLSIAKMSVQDGYNWGVIHIGENFSINLLKRFRAGLEADNETIDGSTIKVYLDMTNQQIGYIIQKVIFESFQNFAREMLESTGASTALANLPVSMEPPIYGTHSPSFTEFMAPGVILSITYIMAVGLTSLTFVEERKSGLMDRSWVSGVTSTQVLVSHVFTQFFVLMVQVFGLLIFTFLVFDIPSRGPFVWVILLTLLQGTCGMAYGMLISSVCDEETSAVMLSLGSFYPNLLLSGIIWPVEGMPHFIRFISYCLPQTIATEAIRAILSRGWGLAYSVVWSGFLITTAWTVFFLIAAATIFRIRK